MAGQPIRELPGARPRLAIVAGWRPNMTRGYKIVGVVVGIALVAAVALGALLFTQPAAAAAVSAAVGVATGRNANNGGGGALGCGQAGLDAAAKALNMTSADLQTQLRGGATLSELAT